MRVNEPQIFRPHALAKAPIISEGRLTDGRGAPHVASDSERGEQ